MTGCDTQCRGLLDMMMISQKWTWSWGVFFNPNGSEVENTPMLIVVQGAGELCLENVRSSTDDQ